MSKRWFWPVFAVAIFMTKVTIIAIVIFVALTKVDPVEGPPGAQQAQHAVGGQHE